MDFPDYSFTSHYHLVNGQRLHYLDEGTDTGETLVMVHGNPSWSFFFRRLVLAFRGQYRCIVPDHLGMGKSDRPSPRLYGYDLASRINDLEDLLDATGAGNNITLILHDWGGMIGMGYACRHPDRVRRLVIMNTAAFHLPAGARFPWQLRIARSLAGPLLVRGLNAFSIGAATWCVARHPLSPAVRRAYLGPYGSWRDRLAVMRFIQDIPLARADRSHALVSEIEAGLKNFATTPMLICWGLRDFIFTEPFLQAWRKYFPAADTVVIEDAGHYLLEDAADEVITRMQVFFAANPTVQNV